MIDDEVIFDPVKRYNSEFKLTFKENATEFFNKLVNKSNVDEEENDILSKEYETKLAEKDVCYKKLGSQKGVKIFLIVLTVISFLFGLAGLVLSFVDENEGTYLKEPWWIAICIISILLGIGFILIICLVINKNVKRGQNKLEELTKAINEKHDKLMEMMLPLHKLYTYNFINEIIRTTTPILRVYPQYRYEDECYFTQRFGMLRTDSDDSTTLHCLYGTILNNPFLLRREREFQMGTKQYTGSMVITYTETYTDSEGHTRTRTVTQTLFAHVVKPCPKYYDNTKLYYGNEACPDLSFARYPSGVDTSSEKSINKFIEKTNKQLDKLAEKSTMSGKAYTKMGNDKFEALFNANDRDNEVQFRVLFSPIAQTSMTNLILEGKPFGDDFFYGKAGKLNIIKSNHSQIYNYHISPNEFFTYSLKKEREYFISRTCNFFEHLYFDLAPLLCSPVYQESDTEFDYKAGDHIRNLAFFQYEACINRYYLANIIPDGCITKTISKTRFISKDGDTDKIQIITQGFSGTPMVDFVPVMGGDGCMHSVPVHWIQYDPVSKVTYSSVSKIHDAYEEETYKKDKKMSTVEEIFNEIFSTDENGSIQDKYAKGISIGDICDDDILTKHSSKSQTDKDLLKKLRDIDNNI